MMRMERVSGVNEGGGDSQLLMFPPAWRQL